MTDRAAHTLVLASPAASFLDAFLLGNGSLGAAVHGTPGTERFDLNADTLWSGGPAGHDDVVDGPDRPAALEELRAAVAERRFEDADRLAEELHGHRFSASYQPAGQLGWTYGPADAAGYERRLALDDAVARVAYRVGGSGEDEATVECRAFVSAPDGVLVAEARGTAGRPGLAYEGPHPGTRVERAVDDDGTQWLVATGRVPAEVVPSYVGDVDDPVRYADDPPDDDGLVDAGMGFAVVAATGRTGDRTRLVATVVTGFRGHAERPSADLPALARAGRATVEAALARPTAALLEDHRAEHRGWYDRAEVALRGRAERDARYANLGRYLLIACSRPGTQAATLQGIWSTEVRPAWSCNYTTNINVQMAYWPADVYGLGELTEPLAALVRDLADAGRDVARRYYGASGAAVHHNSDLWRFATPVPLPARWGSWPSALWWLSSQVDDADVDAAAVDFALDMLVAHPDGDLVVSPSTSPENLFVTPSGGRAAVSAGTTLDQELVHEVLARYVARPPRPAPGGAVPPPEAGRRARAADALARLRAPQVGDDGLLLEWADAREPDEPGHRHLSHLYGLYPGTRITAARTPAALAAARRALHARLAAGSGGTGWSRAWVLCLAARLREPELARSSLDTLLGPLCSASLLDLHPVDEPPGAVFQIDGNLGGAAGVAELLLQSHEGFVALLPTLPGSWDDGRFRGLRTREGHVVDAEWSDGRPVRARLTGGIGGRVTLDVPAAPSAPSAPTVTVDGVPVPVRALPASVPGRSHLAWDTEPGCTYDVVW